MPVTQPSPPPARVHPSQPITCDTFSPPLSQLFFLAASSLAGAWVQQLLAPCTCSWDWKRWGFFLPAPVQKVPGETLPGPNSECPFSGTVSSFFCVVIPALWPGGQQRHQESLLGEYARWTQKKAFIQACLSFEPKQIISFIHLFTQPSNHPSIRPSVRPPTHPLTHPSIHPPTNLVIEHLFIKHLHVQGSVVSEVDIAVHKIQLLPPRVDRPVGRRGDRCISYKNAITKPRSRAWGTLVKGAYPRGWEEVMGRSRGWWIWRRTCLKPHLDTSGMESGWPRCMCSRDPQALCLPEAVWSSLGISHPPSPSPSWQGRPQPSPLAILPFPPEGLLEIRPLRILLLPLL